MRKTNIFEWGSPAKKKEAELSPFLHAYVHPCVINKQPYIVYPRGLIEKSPHLFSKLARYYQNKGYTLKEDQRSDKCSDKFKNERRKWVPVVLFTASLLFESTVFADIELQVNEGSSLENSHQVALQLIPTSTILNEIKSHVPPNKLKEDVRIKSSFAQSIFEILNVRYQKQKSDPDYIVDDLKLIANYYSDFPESISLLTELKNKNWTLVFDENNWLTTGSGNMLQVDKAVIHFNTRSAAQLRLNNGCKDNPVCIASPADALLHELLHAHSMLVKSDEFISQGGMNNVMYPYKHEYAVIGAERQLYAKMSMYDDIKRPQRREHIGRTVKAHCPTCIK